MLSGRDRAVSGGIGGFSGHPCSEVGGQQVQGTGPFLRARCRFESQSQLAQVCFGWFTHRDEVLGGLDAYGGGGLLFVQHRPQGLFRKPALRMPLDESHGSRDPVPRVRLFVVQHPAAGGDRLTSDVQFFPGHRGGEVCLRIVGVRTGQLLQEATAFFAEVLGEQSGGFGTDADGAGRFRRQGSNEGNAVVGAGRREVFADRDAEFWGSSSVAGEDVPGLQGYPPAVVAAAILSLREVSASSAHERYMDRTWSESASSFSTRNKGRRPMRASGRRCATSSPHRAATTCGSTPAWAPTGMVMPSSSR